jgi:hypothetical protein
MAHLVCLKMPRDYRISGLRFPVTRLGIFASLCFLLVLRSSAQPPFAAGGKPMPFALTTTAFQPGGDIPRKYTCQGADVSPALAWTDAPAGAQSFALLVDDPDAPVGTWVHWVVYDLPATARGLPEGVPKTPELPGGGRQGANDFGKLGYGGPCPPPGNAHRYFFKLYALKAPLNLQPGATKKDVVQAMQGQVLGEVQLVGKYKRQ